MSDAAQVEVLQRQETLDQFLKRPRSPSPDPAVNWTALELGCTQIVYLTVPPQSKFPSDHRVRAQIMSVGNVVECKSARWQGFTFTCVIADYTGWIHAHTFGDEEKVKKSAKELGENIGKVAYFEGTLRVAKKEWSDLPHNYELVLRTNPKVPEARGWSLSSIGLQRHVAPSPVRVIRKFRELSQAIVGMFTVIAVVGKVEPLDSRESKTEVGAMVHRRTIVLDDGETPAELTLWGELAVSWTAAKNQRVQITHAQLDTYTRTAAAAPRGDNEAPLEPQFVRAAIKTSRGSEVKILRN